MVTGENAVLQQFFVAISSLFFWLHLHPLLEFFACWESLIKCYSNYLKCSAKSKGEAVSDFFFLSLFIYLLFFFVLFCNTSESEA